MKQKLIELIRAALHEHFKYLREGGTLPELWCVKFKLDIGALKYRRDWLTGFASAAKHGMWWTMDVEDYVYLHGTRGEPPVVDRLHDLILWLNSLEVVAKRNT